MHGSSDCDRCPQISLNGMGAMDFGSAEKPGVKAKKSEAVTIGNFAGA